MIDNLDELIEAGKITLRIISIFRNRGDRLYL
jgi:hypothetical protein